VARVTRQNEVSVEHCLCRHDRVEVRTRSRPATHADQHHSVCRDFGRLAIHQHLAPLPECRDGTTGNSCQPFVAAFNSLSSRRNSPLVPARDGMGKMRRDQRWADPSEKSASALDHKGTVLLLSVGLSTRSPRMQRVCLPCNTLTYSFWWPHFRPRNAWSDLRPISRVRPRTGWSRTRTSVFFGILGRGTVVLQSPRSRYLNPSATGPGHPLIDESLH